MRLMSPVEGILRRRHDHLQALRQDQGLARTDVAGYVNLRLLYDEAFSLVLDSCARGGIDPEWVGQVCVSFDPMPDIPKEWSEVRDVPEAVEILERLQAELSPDDATVEVEGGKDPDGVISNHVSIMAYMQNTYMEPIKDKGLLNRLAVMAAIYDGYMDQRPDPRPKHERKKRLSLEQVIAGMKAQFQNVPPEAFDMGASVTLAALHLFTTTEPSKRSRRSQIAAAVRKAEGRA